ncbi:MAG: tetratricopeptide repeat protein [Chitinivibrionales bacterium]|nr:tetratricopeptide repeat protein [Chitinivibrionales bacterium]
MPMWTRGSRAAMNSTARIIKEAISLHQRGEIDKAEQSYRRVLQEEPYNADALHLLGLICHQRGNSTKAVDLIRQALASNARQPVFHFNLANILDSLGTADTALHHYKQVIELDPANADAHYRMGNIYRKQNRYDKAVGSYKAAVDIRPDFAFALNNLGAACKACGNYSAAVEYFRRAAALLPESAESKNNLGMALVDCGDIDEALVCFRTALSIKPGLVPALVNLGKELMLQGEHPDAEQCLAQALKYKPDHTIAHNNLLVCKNYSPETSPARIYSEHLLWAHSHAAQFTENAVSRPNYISDKRIRVGYVSPDFYHHPVAYFISPVLKNHNHVQYEIFCYSDVLHEDEVTEECKKHADTWRSTAGLSDSELSARICDDNIHILIDLTGHLAGNRLLAFARKPAKVQISYLGYPCTTGLSAMDYYLTDSILDAAGDEPYYSESLIRLPGCFCCYAPPANAPGAGPLPFRQNGFITFGSLHNLARLNPAVLDVWADLLKEIAGSRLLIFRTGITRHTYERLHAYFARKGIESSRIEISGSCDTNYLFLYNKIDIALDTFPWSGHTTACEALWMGVPVVTLCGNRHAGRMVTSIVSSLGMDFLATESTRGYIHTTKLLARDPDRLESVRAGLRETMSGSSLCDGRRFIVGYERALRSTLE